MKVFVEICILISGCLAILEVKERAKESSNYLHYFPAAFLMPLGGTPTWWLHTGLFKFAQKIFRQIFEDQDDVQP